MVSVDLIALATALGVPYHVDTPVERLLQTHREAHSIAAVRQQPFPNIRKSISSERQLNLVEYLRNAY